MSSGGKSPQSGLYLIELGFGLSGSDLLFAEVSFSLKKDF
jgi:hypothetical protein